ncbi:S41 family peptidase [Hyalangium minutum]|uniref:Tail specific protease domain-containing protein n=1 Tax=Hyalangium minutum TaxID=394096 RepID=A0A085WPN8_9BACT|nr:S41 family peptidase [Hyalangium minutum]KFE69651.1 hypothetical protein DB31_6626 [Hyalangium minutum]
MPRLSRFLRLVLKGLAGLFLALMVLLVAGYFWLKHSARPSELIGLTVPQDQREKETARLQKLGLRVPPEGVVLEHPFDPPWTSRSMVVPSRWLLQPGVRILLSRDMELRPADVLADLDLLETVMSRAYGGWVSAEEQGWDWKAWFAGWRQKLRDAGDRPLSIDEAFQPMDALYAVRLDNHTQVPLQRMETGSVSQSAVLARAPQGTCTRVRNRQGVEFALNPKDAGQQPRKALSPDPGLTRLEDIQYLSVPSARGELAAVECSGEWIELSPVGGPRDSSLKAMLFSRLFVPSDKPEVRRLSPEAVYARIPGMYPELYQGIEQKRATWPQPTGQERVLIVDLRGNSGGSSDYGWQVLQGWVDPQRAVTMERLGHTLSASCFYASLKWNFSSVFMGGLQPPLDEADHKDLQEGIELLEASYPEECPREDTETPPQWTWKDHQFQRAISGMRIITLVDNSCGSDCELLTLQLGSLPETVVVGRNTGGVCQFIQPGYGILPHTRLPFRIALGESNPYGDHRSVDGYGLDVDVLLRGGEDWTPERVARLAELLR